MPVLKAMVLPAPERVPPIVLPPKPPEMNTPVPLLSGTLPVRSDPMKFPCTRLLPAKEPTISIPGPVLPETTLPAPANAPPIVLSFDESDTPVSLGRGELPVALVPMKLPSIRLFVQDPVIWTPSPVLLEMTLRAAVDVAATVVSDAAG